MKENSKVNNKKEGINFEKKIISIPTIGNSIMQFLNKKDMLSLINTSKNIQTKVANSASCRASGMYVDYLNCLKETVDGFVADLNDSNNGKTFSDIANKVYESDFGELCELLVKKESDEQKKFRFNTGTKKINSLLESCLKIYMMHMILIDLLSITEEDFIDCNIPENFSMESVIMEIINKRQQERIEKVFDAIVNNKKFEIKTFWDEIQTINKKKYNELKIEKIDEKKYDELKIENTNECRDMVYSFLFQKIFNMQDENKNMISGIESKINKYGNQDRQAIEQTIKDEIDEKRNFLDKQLKDLRLLQNEIKTLESGLNELKNKYDQAQKKIEGLEDPSELNIAVKRHKDYLSEEKSSKEQDLISLKTKIQSCRDSISNLENRLDEKKLFDDNRDRIVNLYDTTKNRFENFHYGVFNFLLNHPDRISSFNFDPLKLNNSVARFIVYLFENNKNEYFYSAIIETGQMVNEKNIGECINGVKRYLDMNNLLQDPNINVDFVEKILFDCRYSGWHFYEQQLKWTRDEDVDISFVDILFVIIALAMFIYAVVWPIASCFEASWAFSCFAIFVYVLSFFCASISMFYFPSKLFLVYDFLHDYSARKKRRVIYDPAISQLETCKQNTQTYKTKITNQKKIFDKVKKLRDQKLKDLNEPVPKGDSKDSKSAEEIKTQ